MIIDGSYFTGLLSLGIIWDIDDDSITRKAERDNRISIYMSESSSEWSWGKV